MPVMKYCTRCLAPDTRPRIGYDAEGVCNACRHAERKKATINWKDRWSELEKLCDKYRRKDGYFDVMVPCSGGKDGGIVAWKLKYELGMHPLAVTFRPQVPTEIGKKNLENFISSGFDHMLITAHPEKEMRVSKYGFITQGQPKLSAMIGQTTALAQIAVNMNIPFIVYGEEGESEYGGVDTISQKHHFTKEEIVEVYFEKNAPEEVEKKAGLSSKDMVWWYFPDQKKLDESGLIWAYFSRFEDWNPYEHYLFAKKHCGFQALPERSIGTYTNFAQLDDDMQDLHAYMMFIKFGFGRATSDACIDVRRGALDRKQALALVRRYDGEYPERLIPVFLDYFKMTKEEFDEVLDRLANKEVLRKVDGIWRLKEPAY
ncbi:MAG: N-acetyl sugar amidotransferase [Candidatus Omnitrophota bacterium]